MKPLLTLLAIVSTSLCFAQAPTKAAEAMKAVDFLSGTWKGTQKFNNSMEATVRAETKLVVSGRFLEEALSVDLKGKKSDTRHLLTYDPKTSTYKAWWFNDTRPDATAFEGKLDGDKLILNSKPMPGPGGQEITLRVTYEKLAKDQLGYGLEMTQGEDWVQLFHTTYSRA